MKGPIIYFDMNEHLGGDFFLLSSEDAVEDIHGNIVPLWEGREIAAMDYDCNEEGEDGCVIFDAVVVSNSQYKGKKLKKWACLIDVRTEVWVKKEKLKEL